MPPSVEPAPVRVELGPLRELLAVDRRQASEVRRAQALAPQLATASYAMPLRVQWRRAFRRNRRLRVAVWSALSCIMAASLCGAALLWGPTAADAAGRAKSAVMVWALPLWDAGLARVMDLAGGASFVNPAERAGVGSD